MEGLPFKKEVMTYTEELKRLRKKIERQYETEKAEYAQ